MMMIKRLIFNLILFVYVATTYSEAAAKCYVCGKGADEPFKMNRDYVDDDDGIVLHGNNASTAATTTHHNFSSSCDIFDKSVSQEDFIYECPSGYVGCITQISGNDVMRTCDILRINDCKTANGVKYCYCATDLCNGKIVESILPKPRGLHKKFIQNSDDEDFMESSGMSETSLLHLNDDEDERDTDHNDDDDDVSSRNRHRNVNDDFHTENINHIDLSDPLWTTLATSTTNDNRNYRLTTTEHSSKSNLTGAKSQSSLLLVASFHFNLLILVIYLVFN